MKLRDSERLDELRTQYEKVWNTLLHYEEKEAENLIQDFSSQIDFHDKRKYGVKEVKGYLKTPLPYVAMFVGMLVPAAIFMYILLMP
ncbi:hypothetical protein ABE099_11730 [Paenibacillus turicensis]|uniref:hypothetical protein n=1 Tax=Paenibacillus turicensis TaxID=160487 RepID=UPI003D2BF0D6